MSVALPLSPSMICLFLRGDLLLTGDRLPFSFSRPRVRARPLATDGQALPVAQSAVRVDVHQALDVHLHLAAPRAFDFEIRGDNGADLRDFVVVQIADTLSPVDARLVQDLVGTAPADAEDVR